MTGRGRRAVRIANCSGFYGDRLSALAEVVRQGDVDIVTGDYLAEATMLVLAKARLKNPALGFATTFTRQLEPVVGEIAERGIKVVVNAGGLNPRGLAERVRELVGDAGLDLRIAYVDGDDITARIAELQGEGHALHHLTTGEPLNSWRFDPLTANAYLGGFGIARALERGADVVLTGRVADASLVAGSAAWWYGWGPLDYDQVAGAVAAGHVIECGTQATGGNFSGFTEVPELEHPGFPVAEVRADGSSVITKHAGTGGVVTTDTVKAQLLYEVAAGPYLNPDVVAHLDHATLAQVGPDRVEMTGVRGSTPPATTKVSITALAGWQNSTLFAITEPRAEEKIALIERTVRRKLATRGELELSFTRIGVGDPDADDQFRGTCLLRVLARGDQETAGRAFSALMVEMALATYPGHYQLAPPSGGSSYGSYWPGLVDQGVLSHRVVHDDGSVELVARPDHQQVRVEPLSESGATSPPGGPRRTVVLETLLHARSGDKGGDVNLGVWVRDPAAWGWLRSELTVPVLREILPELGDLRIDRFEFPRLHALNFHVQGLLGDGATSTTRFDRQGKALGEWLRAKKMDVPVEIADRGAGAQAPSSTSRSDG